MPTSSCLKDKNKTKEEKETAREPLLRQQEQIKKEIAESEVREEQIKKELDSMLHRMGNIVHESVPVSETEVKFNLFVLNINFLFQLYYYSPSMMTYRMITKP
jgi:seryl-tRNA synthetase